MNREQQFKNRLRLAGERVTTPRLAVFRVLTRHAPLAMPKLIAKGREDGIDTVTVYRTVDLFRKLGLIAEVGLGRNRMFELGDDYHAHHHHFICTNCGKIFDFDSESIEADLQAVGQRMGLKISSHQLEVTGTCAECSHEE